LESDLSVAIVFPGQGSQSQGMQADLAEKCEAVEATYAEASDILGYEKSSRGLLSALVERHRLPLSIQ
jgi:malonyl CoA-acyl carrier protein transacylase